MLVDSKTSGMQRASEGGELSFVKDAQKCLLKSPMSLNHCYIRAFNPKSSTGCGDVDVFKDEC